MAISETNKSATEPEAKPASSARERFRQRKDTKPPPARKPRASSPTRSIEPGMIHYRLAEGLLKTARDRAADRGIPLDVGEFPPTVDVDTGTEDPERLAKLTAHALARIGDRFGFVRKVSRHFEGTERRAGILSDITAAFWVLYRRNPEAVEQFAVQFRAELQARRAAVAAKQAEKQQATNGGVPNHAPV